MTSRGFSQFLPSYEYIPDGEPHVFGERLYLYGSHDRFGGGKFCMNDYVLWSAPLSDLSVWRYEGEIYRRTQDPANKNGELALWAPDVAQGPDGRYYLFYCLADYPQIGVAVCDKPNGPFEYLGCVHDREGRVLGQRENDTLPFDPAVLVDDGRVWLYAGNGPSIAVQDQKAKKASVYMELEADMLTLKSEPTPLIPTTHTSAGTGFVGHEFFEASSIRKFGGLYYFIYSSVSCHELCYALSRAPEGPFTYGGTLVSNGDIRQEDNVRVSINMNPSPLVRNYIGNNHGSLVEVNGKYYIFFHRQTNRNMFSRQACAEEIQMTSDGHFLQAELTSCGLNGGPLEGKGRYEARIACHLQSNAGALFGVHPMVQNETHPAFTQDGYDREDTSNQHIENMRDGAIAGFRYFDFKGAKKLTVTTRGKGSGWLIVRNGNPGEIIAEIAVKPASVWTSFTAGLRVEDGISSLYFTYSGTMSIDFLDFIIE